jgi:hypothetical protein
MRTIFRALCLTLATATAAHAETRERLAENYARHERFAGAEVEEIRNFRLYRWRPLGETALAIWSNPGRLYLVDVAAPCDGLDWAKTIGVTARGRVLSSRFDSVEFAGQHCRIERIRPVDEKGMRAEGER